MLSLIIPTYNEKENIHLLTDRLFTLFKKNKIKAEIIVVDDNSPDGTSELVRELMKKYSNLKLIKRKGKLGLSSAVLDGFKRAKGDILGVMDADLSHPPEAIPRMYKAINTIIPEKGFPPDFVIGSRHTKDGRIVGWKTYRKIVSKGATLLARPFTKAKDPMSGLFMIRKECLEGKEFNAKGFKICLELLVKANWKIVKEIPISFKDRTKGKSKATLKEYYLYLYNLVNYSKYKWLTLTQLIQFGLVGALGTLINIVVLYALTEFLGIYYIYSATFAFIVALTNNFIFNKIWTFKEKSGEKYEDEPSKTVINQYGQFFLFGVLALGINLSFLYILVEWFRLWYIFAQIIAIFIAYVVNFAGSKLLVFKK